MSFNDILGQELAIKILKRIVETKRIANSYLFWGPEAVGKKMAALAFARTLNCEESDLIILEPRGPIRRHHIGTIREMQDFVSLRSFYGGWKVVIMDEAERMTEEAAASLLKILEEPPAKTIFILVSSHHENIFKTIISRCQDVRFLPLSKDVQRKILEKHPLTPEKEAWRKEILSWKFLPNNIFQISQKIVDNKDSDSKQVFIMDTLHLLFTWFRDVLFTKEGLGEVLNRDYEKELADQARRLSLEALWGILQAIIQAQREIARQVNSRLVLDTLFLTLSKTS